MPATVLQTQSAAFAVGGVSASVTLTGCQAGSRIIVATAMWVDLGEGRAAPTTVGSTPALAWQENVVGGFAQLGDAAYNGQQVALWSAEAPSGGEYHIEALFGGGIYGNIVAMEVAGLAALAIDRTATASANNTSDITPSVGPTLSLSQAEEFAVAVLGASTGSGSSVDIGADLASGWTRAFYQGDAATAGGIAVDYRNVSSTAAITADWGTVATHTDAWSAALATYRLAGVGSGPPVEVAGGTTTVAVSGLGGVASLGPPPPVSASASARALTASVSFSAVLPGGAASVSLPSVPWAAQASLLAPPPVVPALPPLEEPPGRARHLRGLRIAGGSSLLASAPPNSVPISTPLEPVYPGAVEVFYDDFPGLSLDRVKWREVLSGGGENFVFDPAMLSVSNGLLIRTMWDGTLWRTGGIRQGTSTQQVGGFKYAQVSVCARVSPGRGYGPVFTLWPTASGGAWTNEISLLEAPSVPKLSGWNRVRGMPPETVQDAAEFSADLTEWHVYTARWEQGRVVFYLDGAAIRTVTSISVDQSLAVMLHGFVAAASNGFYGAAPNDFSAKRIDVAYVRVSQLPGGPAPPDDTPRFLSFEPEGPGALAETTIGAGATASFVVKSAGISSLTYVTVRNDFVWRNPPTTVSTGGKVTITPRFYAQGEFVKVMKADDFNVFRNSGIVTAFSSPQPPAEPPPTVGFFEDFNGSGVGQMGHVWGDQGQISVSGGVLRLGGTYNGVGVMSSVPDVRNPNGGFGNGLFEYRAQLRGSSIGDNSGPALVLWPANDYWTAQTVRNNGGTFPDHLSREVDVGEINGGGITYVAHHYTDCGWNRPDCDAYVAFDLPGGHDQWQWHVYGVRLETSRITYYVDGVQFATDTAHPSPDTAHGGINHIIGIMNRSSNTECWVDWVKWTPEGGVVQPPPTPTTGATIDIGSGSDTIVLLFAQDYYQGSAEYTVRVDGVQIGGTLTAQARNNLGQTDTVTVRGNWGTSGHTVQVTFLNDLYAGTPALDRNLFLKSASYNGNILAGVSMNLSSNGSQSFSFGTFSGGGGGTGAINILVRGQSNALLFCDWGGAGAMQDALQGAGRQVNIMASWGPGGPENNYTIYSGSGFISWNYDGKQAGIQRHIQNLSGDRKSAPFITLWMHNESDMKDHKDEWTSQSWADRIREDAGIMRSAAGRSASEAPYVFVPIRYNYGDITKMMEGFEMLAGDPSFNGHISMAAWSAAMDGDGYANSSHMGPGDTVNTGRALAQFILSRW